MIHGDKPFLLFSGLEQSRRRGMYSCIGACPTYDEAKAAKPERHTWGHVVLVDVNGHSQIQADFKDGAWEAHIAC